MNVEEISLKELKRRRLLVIEEVEDHKRRLGLAQSRLEVLDALIVGSEEE